MKYDRYLLFNLSHSQEIIKEVENNKKIRNYKRNIRLEIVIRNNKIRNNKIRNYKRKIRNYKEKY